MRTLCLKLLNLQPKMNKTLNNWIAESESWQSFIDFKLPEEEKASQWYFNKARNVVKVEMNDFITSYDIH